MIQFPNVVSDYGRWYELIRANIEYSLRQKLYQEIEEKMINDFKERLEPQLEEIVKSVSIERIDHMKNLERMRDDVGVRFNVTAIRKVEPT